MTIIIAMHASSPFNDSDPLKQGAANLTHQPGLFLTHHPGPYPREPLPFLSEPSEPPVQHPRSSPAALLRHSTYRALAPRT